MCAGIFLPKSSERIRSFSGVSEIMCSTRKLSSFCGFRHVIYYRNDAHAHIEYFLPPAPHGQGRREEANQRGLGKGGQQGQDPAHVHLVHQLQCCPHYHATIPLMRATTELNVSNCDVFVEHDTYLLGVVNAYQYGHVLHETIMALFHTILTFSPGRVTQRTCSLFRAAAAQTQSVLVPGGSHVRTSSEECCEACKALSACTAWTFRKLADEKGREEMDDARAGRGGAGGGAGECTLHGGEVLDLAAAEDCEAGVMEQVAAAASRELVLVSDLLDAPAILGKLTVLFEALSDIPWLSFSTLRAQGRAICFQRLVAGLSDGMNMFATAQTVESDPASSPVAESRHVRLLRRSIFQALTPMLEPPVTLSPRRVAFIHRSQTLTTRRGIFNMDELINVASGWGDESVTLEFETMSLLAQVQAMQSVTVVVGVTGTGLWNAIWMREGGLGVQLFPFGVGIKGGVEFEHAIRHGPGHYVAWHAPRFYQDNIRPNGHDSCAAPRGCYPEELLTPTLNMPALAFTDPEAYWQQDWGGAWMIYYGQDAIYVDPVAFAGILRAYASDVLTPSGVTDEEHGAVQSWRHSRASQS